MLKRIVMDKFNVFLSKLLNRFLASGEIRGSHGCDCEEYYDLSGNRGQLCLLGPTEYVPLEEGDRIQSRKIVF
jgi:hypothetical protein